MDWLYIIALSVLGASFLYVRLNRIHRETNHCRSH